MMCEHTAPPLTTVRQNVAALAAGAVDILVQQIKGQASEHDEVVFAPELVVRASTGPHTGAVRVHSST